MKLTLFVHDCFLEIGHSNAVIETIRNVKGIERLDIVSYSSDDPIKLFPDLDGKVFFHKVPFTKLKPILIKVVFFHIYSALYTLFHPRSIKISIGIASLCADVINIQFIHAHWKDFFFKSRKMPILTLLYKRVLFWYFSICENYLFNRPKMLFSSLSKYVAKFCLETFNIDSNRIKIIYSAVNLNRYKIEQKTRSELFQELKERYSELSSIDRNKPIFLFVGAYQRKGLPHALKAIEHFDSTQMIIIGAEEKGTKIEIPQNIKTAQIKYTREVPLFYQLCDSFIFPTFYEPYGLVIAEAAAMGMHLYTTINNVGATEILHNLEHIHLFDTPEQVKVISQELVSTDEKIRLRKDRIEKVFTNYSWQAAGKEFEKLLLQLK